MDGTVVDESPKQNGGFFFGFLVTFPVSLARSLSILTSHSASASFILSLALLYSSPLLPSFLVYFSRSRESSLLFRFFPLLRLHLLSV